MNKLLIFIAVLVFGLANGQFNRTCTHTKLITPAHFFETDRAMGKWYGIEFYAGLTEDAHPMSFKCIEMNFTRTSDPLELHGSETYIDIDSGVSQTDEYNILIDTDSPNEAVWKFIYADGTLTSDSVWIHTDYDNWVIQYGCQVMDNYRYESFAFWSRERTIDPRTLAILRVLANGYGFPPQNGVRIEQMSC